MKYLERILFVVNSSLGVAITIEDAKNVIGIIILIFQALLVIYNVITKIVNHVKNGKVEEIPQAIQNGIDDLNQLKDSNDSKDGDAK